VGEEAIRSVHETPLGVPPAPGTDPAFELELAALPRNDIGNAERFMRRRGHDFLWVKDAGWYAWDGKRWNFDGGEVAVRLAAHGVAEAMHEEAVALEKAGPLVDDDETPKQFEERIEKAFKWATGAGNSARLAAMRDEAAARLARRQEELDADPFVFNVANGTLELGQKDAEGGVAVRLRGHDRRDLITRISPVAYDPEASAAPQWRAFLDYFLPDREVQTFLQRYFGYCLTGSIAEQCLVLLHGEGSNGKSTLVDLMAWLLGDYAMLVPIQSLLMNDRKGGSEASPDLARLPGARLVRSSEPKQGATFDESLLKQLTSGEPIAVRHLNKGFFDFLPAFKLILSFNRRPTVRGDDDGIWRRLFMVPFERQIQRERTDKTFLAKLKAEGPAILNWVVDGYRLWRESGLVVPDAVRAATQDYRADSDRLGNFLTAACAVTGDPSDKVTAAEFYTAYAAWCKRNAVEPMSQNAVGRRLSERRKIIKVRVGSVHYQGVRLVDRTLLGEERAS